MSKKALELDETTKDEENLSDVRLTSEDFRRQPCMSKRVGRRRQETRKKTIGEGKEKLEEGF